MIGHELEALRRLLFYSRPEAAALVAAVEERSWNRWERGERAIPAGVEERVRALVRWRSDAILTASRVVASAPGDEGGAAVYYTSAEDWTSAGREPVYWRPHQSAIAEIAARDPRVRLVAFDLRSYRAWLGRRRDSEEFRGAWAATISRGGARPAS